MHWQIIDKRRAAGQAAPNLADYDAARAGFSWEQARRELAGLPGGKGLNIAHEAVDRHAAGPRRDHPALRWIGRDGQAQTFTYGDLRGLSSRFANVLRDLGVGKGERVFTLTGRIPELYIAALGTMKAGAVFCPLFSAFGPEPIAARLGIGGGRVLVTTDSLYRRKVADIRTALPALEHVLVVADAGQTPPDTHDLRRLLAAADDAFEIPPTDPEDPALLHFTSGTTGAPKGAVHVHGAVLMHHLTGKWVLDLRPDDVFWCTADPGWVTGTSYGIIAPLVNGVTNVVDEGEFDAGRWYGILEQQRVTVWYTAPTAVRLLMKQGLDLIKDRDLSRLRHVASAGEPLNPEAVVWGQEAFGIPIHDTWWQTETGAIMIANYPAMAIKPGAMGRPLPGVEAAVVHRTDQGVEAVRGANVLGQLALRAGWPSMFRGYWGDAGRYRDAFADGWYLTGDLARRDEDGYFHFVSRSDDVIKSAGHLIGPFEVENVLLEHPAVAEVGVIGKPDMQAGEVVKAFVALKPGFAPGEDLRRELLALARRRLGPVVAPREIDFRDSLPKTRTGKIMRRLLKSMDQDTPRGDLSALDDEAQ
ncbi:MAG: acetate--CoA ligase [Pseudomonadota bacterium]|nr:acetate--CoA ligase [Pseudomonadota bacterium]